MIETILAVILAAMRVGGVTHEAFQAIAHIYVGYIFTAAWYTKSKLFWWLGSAVSLIELAVFINDKTHWITKFFQTYLHG